MLGKRASRRNSSSSSNEKNDLANVSLGKEGLERLIEGVRESPDSYVETGAVQEDEVDDKQLRQSVISNWPTVRQRIPFEQHSSFVNSLIAIFAADAADRLQLLMVVALEEVKGSDPSTLFRENTLGVKLLTGCLVCEGRSWIREACVLTMRKVITGQVGEGDSQTLDIFAEQILKQLNRKVSRNCPLEVALVLQAALAAVDEHLPDAAVSAQQYASSFLYLLVITPCVVNPKKTGIVVEDLDAGQLRVFASMGKSILKWVSDGSRPIITTLMTSILSKAQKNSKKKKKKKRSGVLPQASMPDDYWSNVREVHALLDVYL